MPLNSLESPKQNRILAALTANDYARLQDDLERVSLKLGQVLFESGDGLGYVYFPATCIVSLIFTTRKGPLPHPHLPGQAQISLSLFMGRWDFSNNLK